MLDEAKLEERLAVLEQTVQDLQKQLAATSRAEKIDSEDKEPWWKSLAIPPENEDAFLEALEYGRAYRQADRPADETSLV